MCGIFEEEQKDLHVAIEDFSYTDIGKNKDLEQVWKGVQVRVLINLLDIQVERSDMQMDREVWAIRDRSG